MTISVTTGITSGIDYEEIIQATLDVEQVRIDTLKTKKEDFETTISAYGALKSSLSALQEAAANLEDSKGFYVYAATSSDEDILTVSVGGQAQPGTYEIEVTQIAKPAIVMGSAGFTSKSETVGTGTLSIAVGAAAPTEIEIAENADTLADIVAAINAADVGVSASIMQVTDGGYALALTADENGKSISFSVTADDDGDTGDTAGLSSLYADAPTESMTLAQEGSTAKFSLNNKEFERSGNDITDLIEGVSISLEGAREDSWVTVQVTSDTSGLSDKVRSFADAYNSLVDTLNVYQDEGDEETVGILFGDNTTNRIKSKIQGLIFTAVENADAGQTYLSRLGVEMDDAGYLLFDEDVFQASLQEDADAVMNFFTNETDGFAVKAGTLLESYLDTDGILIAKIDGYTSSIDRVDEKIATLEEKLAETEDRLRTQYAALETLLSELQNTQDSVTSLLDSLNSD